MTASDPKPLYRRFQCPDCGIEQWFKNTALLPTLWHCQGSGCSVSCEHDTWKDKEPVFYGQKDPEDWCDDLEFVEESELHQGSWPPNRVSPDVIPSQWFEVTPVGVRILGDVPEDVWADTLGSLLRFRKALPWIIGDMIIHGETHYGDTYTQAIEVTGRAYYTLAGYVRVCKAIPLAERRDDVDFSYYKSAAHHALPVPDRIELLEEAAQGKFENSTEFSDAVQKKIDPERVIFKPETVDCPICGGNGWDVQALNKAECGHCHAKGIELADLAERYHVLKESFDQLVEEYNQLLSTRTKVEAKS